MRNKRYRLPVCVMVLFLVVGNVFAAEPESLLVNMAKKMAAANTFSVSIHMAYDVMQTSGQKIEFRETRHLNIDRPNRMRVDADQGDGEVSQLIYDGNVLTLFNSSENVYAQTERPGDLDKVLRHAVGTMGMRIPLARMLVTTFPQEIQKMTSSSAYVGRVVLGDTPTDQIAGQTEEVDYQVWIAEDNLPRRIVLTYKNAPGQPQFRADFMSWNLSPKSKAATFTFTPPKGAEKIPILLPTAKVESRGSQ